MSICYPSTTDWGCAYSPEKIAEMRSDPETLRKMQLSEARAWYTLAALTAWRIGVCPTLVRPVAACHAPYGSWMAAPVSGGGNAGALPLRTIGALNVTPYVTGGVWVNACGCGPSVCTHDSMSSVYLPGPVGDIEYVKLDGEIIDRSRYMVYDGNRLVSLDPELVFPASQDLRSGPDDFGAFAVSYYQGVAPNELVSSAAGALAVEFYKSCMGDSKCRLPRRVTQVSRRGTTYEVDTGLFADGLTRIAEVDAVILMLNPNRLKQAPRIVAPELSGARNRPTWGNW